MHFFPLEWGHKAKAQEEAFPRISSETSSVVLEAGVPGMSDSLPGVNLHPLKHLMRNCKQFCASAGTLLTI